MFNTGLYVYFNAASSGAVTTADNGLTINPAGNVQLGGALLANTDIDLDNGKLILSDLGNVMFSWEYDNVAAAGVMKVGETGGLDGYLNIYTGNGFYSAIQIFDDVGDQRVSIDGYGLAIFGKDSGSPGKVQIYSGAADIAQEIYTGAGPATLAAWIGGDGDATFNVLRAYDSNEGIQSFDGLTLSVKYAEMNRGGLCLFTNATYVNSVGTNEIRISAQAFTPTGAQPRIVSNPNHIQASTATITHTFPIWINGVQYYLMLSTTR